MYLNKNRIVHDNDDWRHEDTTPFFTSNVQSVSTNRPVFTFEMYAVNAGSWPLHIGVHRSHRLFRGGSVTCFLYFQTHVACTYCNTIVHMLWLFPHTWLIHSPLKLIMLAVPMFILKVMPARECIHGVLFLWKGVNSTVGSWILRGTLILMGQCTKWPWASALHGSGDMQNKPTVEHPQIIHGCLQFIVEAMCLLISILTKIKSF